MTDKKSYWIVWNKGKTEGFITDDERGAKCAKTGKPTKHHGYLSAPAAGIAFFEAYADEKLTIERVEL